MSCDGCACGNDAEQIDEKQTLQPKDCLDVDDESVRRNKALQSTGAQLIDGDFVRGIRVAGWSILTRKGPILKMGPREKLEKTLGTIHLPEMVFGDNSLELIHEATGVKIHFNALDALRSWRQESLPPVQIPAAAKWKFRTKPDEQVILDYDYTFTTPYAGSQFVDNEEGEVEWVECEERIDMAALQARDPILFYDEFVVQADSTLRKNCLSLLASQNQMVTGSINQGLVRAYANLVVLYEDELADNGISLLTAKVRVMPTCWFLLLRFWMRVDGALMRLRDTRMFCRMQSGSTAFPMVIRERSIKEDSFEALASKGYPKDSAMYNDPNVAGERLSQKHHICEKLTPKSISK